MRHQPNPPAWYTAAHTVQRAVLLELLMAPEAVRDPIALLASRLDHRLADVRAALSALRAVGLVEQDDLDAWATDSARYHEALLPGRP
jgi:DNA-binding IclR family transcriptional regulator